MTVLFIPEVRVRNLMKGRRVVPFIKTQGRLVSSKMVASFSLVSKVRVLHDLGSPPYLCISSKRLWQGKHPANLLTTKEHTWQKNGRSAKKARR